VIQSKLSKVAWRPESNDTNAKEFLVKRVKKQRHEAGFFVALSMASAPVRGEEYERSPARQAGAQGCEVYGGRAAAPLFLPRNNPVLRP
jgi:hypothetical protein